MNAREKAWEALQERWVAGETLSPMEERLRVEHSTHHQLARRELELFSDLGQELAPDKPFPPDAALVARVLRALSGQSPPKLTLVTDERHPGSPSRSRRPLFAALGLAATIALLAGGIALFRGQEESRTAASPAASPVAVTPPPAAHNRSELVFASGEVRADGARAAVGERTLLAGQHVSTGEGRACVRIDPAIDVCLGPRSEIVLGSLSQADTRVRLVRGLAIASLSKRPPGETFSLSADGVVATARGTVFAVEKSAEPEVLVLEGIVDVSDRKTIINLPAHSRLTVRDKAGARPLGRGTEARLRALIGPVGLWQGDSLGVLEVPEATDAVEVSIDQGEPLPLPLSIFVAAGQRDLVLHSGSGALRHERVQVLPGQTHRLSPGLAPAAAGAAHPAPGPDALLDQARQALSRGDAAKALSLYRRLTAIHPNSREAATVLVTMGKLELQTGSPGRALQAFQAYLARGGPLSPEALGGKIRALRALGREGEERAMMEQYLSRYPDGFEAPALKRRLEAARSDP